MIRHARATLPSCFASSSTPTFVLMIFCSVVIALASLLPRARGGSGHREPPLHDCQVKSKLLEVKIKHHHVQEYDDAGDPVGKPYEGRKVYPGQAPTRQAQFAFRVTRTTAPSSLACFALATSHEPRAGAV